MSDPIGYQQDQLYGRNNTVVTLRVKTHSEMVEDSASQSGRPKLYVIENDETTGLGDILYWWDGLDFSMQADSQSQFVTVATFADMITKIRPGSPMFFTVELDEYQGTDEPEPNVPYLWNGTMLLEYNISQCEFQPTF